jgi:hypothetical protein
LRSRKQFLPSRTRVPSNRGINGPIATNRGPMIVRWVAIGGCVAATATVWVAKIAKWVPNGECVATAQSWRHEDHDQNANDNHRDARQGLHELRDRDDATAAVLIPMLVNRQTAGPVQSLFAGISARRRPRETGMPHRTVGNAVRPRPATWSTSRTAYLCTGWH